MAVMGQPRMRIDEVSHSRVLIVAVVTESTSFIAARASEGVFPQALWLLRHTPAILLIWIDLPWLLKALIGAALWTLSSSVLLLLFAASKNELTLIRLDSKEDTGPRGITTARQIR
jgi:hypothetical protein